MCSVSIPVFKANSRGLSTQDAFMPPLTPTVKVLIAGGSYAGLAAALNLLDLGRGLNPRHTKGAPYLHHDDLPRVDFHITIVDERDGFRQYSSHGLSNEALN